MSESTTTKTRNRTLRVTLAAVLVVALVIGVFVLGVLFYVVIIRSAHDALAFACMAKKCADLIKNS